MEGFESMVGTACATATQDLAAALSYIFRNATSLGVGHGFGLGQGTSAEGWIEDALRFWARQIGGGK
jgi:hypothetical protein